MTSPNGWTLDTLEEYLTNQIKSLSKYFTDLSAEREAVNKERFTSSKEAVTAALAAAEKAISAAMIASEKAILKAESAAEKRAEASNEIRAAMIDQQKLFADKAQTDYRFSSFEQRIEESKSSLNKRLDGVDNALAVYSGKSTGTSNSMAFIFSSISAIASIAAVTIAVSILMHHQ
jgi:chromosome segregation ATPase